MIARNIAKYRAELGRSQERMAQLLGVSVTAIRSYEQGWRTIPPHVERQVLFLIAKKRQNGKPRLCWDVKKCPDERRSQCPAWELNVGDLCWFINGTICQGEVQTSWKKKMRLCKECKMLQPLLQPEPARKRAAKRRQLH